MSSNGDQSKQSFNISNGGKVQLANQNGSKRNGFPGTGLQSTKGPVVIKEEDNEHIEDPDEHGKLDKDIKNLVKQSKIDLQRQGKNVQDIQVPKKIVPQNAKGGDQFNNLKAVRNNGTNGGPTMKGNIGPTIKKTVDDDYQKNLFSKLGEEFDIDKVIPKNEQKKQCPKDFEPNVSMQSFDLSIKNYEMESNYSSKNGNHGHNGNLTAAGNSKGFS